MESVPGSISFRKNRRLSSDSKRDSSVSLQAKESKSKQLFEDSFRLFDEDKIVDQQQSERRISPTGSDKKNESDLRHYYKARVQNRRVSTTEQMERSDSTEASCSESSVNRCESSSDSKKKEKSLLTQKANTIDCPPNSLASEIMRVDPENASGFVIIDSPQNDQVQESSFPENVHEDTTEVFTDDEGEGWQTSTPLKEKSKAGTGEDEVFMWVAPDTNQ